jgi:hypothetical protein
MRNTKHPHKLPSEAMAHLDELLDEALKQTFPASDAIAIDIELEAAPGGRDLTPRTSLRRSQPKLALAGST